MLVNPNMNILLSFTAIPNLYDIFIIKNLAQTIPLSHFKNYNKPW